MKNLNHSSSSESFEKQWDSTRLPKEEQQCASRKSFKLHPMMREPKAAPKEEEHRGKMRKTESQNQHLQVRSIAQKSYVTRLIADVERLLASIYRQDSCVAFIRKEALELFREGDIVLKAMQIKHPMFECLKHKDFSCTCYLLTLPDTDLSKKLANLRKLLLEAGKKITTPTLILEPPSKSRDASTSRSKSRPQPKMAYSSNNNLKNSQKIIKPSDNKENWMEGQIPKRFLASKKQQPATEVNKKPEVCRPKLEAMSQVENCVKRVGIEPFCQTSPEKTVRRKVMISPTSQTEHRKKPQISDMCLEKYEHEEQHYSKSNLWMKPPIKDARIEIIESRSASKSKSRASCRSLSSEKKLPTRVLVLPQEDDYEPREVVTTTRRPIQHARRTEPNNKASFVSESFKPSKNQDTVFDRAVVIPNKDTGDETSKYMSELPQLNLATRFRTIQAPVDSSEHLTAIRTVENKYVVAGFSNGDLVFFDIQDDYKPICAYDEHKGPVCSIDLAYVRSEAAEESRLILMTAADDQENILALWDCETLELSKRLGGHEGRVTCAKDLCNEANVVTAGADGKLAFWDFRDSIAFVTCVECSTSPVFSLEFEEESKTLYTGSQEGLVSIWQICYPSPRDLKISLRKHISTCSPVLDLALWTRDFKKLLLLGYDQILRLVCTVTGRLTYFECGTGIADYFMIDRNQTTENARPEPFIFGVTTSAEVIRLTDIRADPHQQESSFHDDHAIVKTSCRPKSQLLVDRGNLILITMEKCRPSFSLMRINL